MSETSSTRVSKRLVGKTCLILWQENYTATKPGMISYAHCERAHLGLGVVTGVDEKTVTFALCLHRMKDFGNRTFSGMNIRQGNNYDQETLPRRRSRRKLYGKNASSKHLVAIYIEGQSGEVLKCAIEGVHWLCEEEKKRIISRLPEIHAMCTKFTKEAH